MLAASLPAGSKVIEAEDHFMKDSNFRSVNNVHVSAGNYIKGKKKASLNKPALLIQTSFPESGKKYTIWVRSKDITQLCLNFNFSFFPIQDECIDEITKYS